MPAWIARTVLSGASTSRNGTNSHTCTFTAATAGNLLVAVVNGPVTFTTPTGWTLGTSAVNNSGLYVFTKTASAAESSFSTTHNGSNYPIQGVIYEYASGSTYLNGSNATSQSQIETGPVVSGLTGTYTRFCARSWTMDINALYASCTWTIPSTEDYDTYTLYAGTTDGCSLTIAYDDGSTGASFNPSSNLTNDAIGSGEGIAFALNVVTSTSMTPIMWTI